MIVDSVTAGKISIEISRLIPDMHVSVVNSDKLNAEDVPADHWIILIEEPDDGEAKSAYDITALAKDFGSDDEIIKVISLYLFPEEHPFTTKGKKDFENRLNSGFEYYKDRLYIKLASDLSVNVEQDSAVPVRHLGNTDLYAVPMLDITDFCRPSAYLMTHKTEGIMFFPELIEGEPELTKDRVFETALENSVNPLRLEDVSYIFASGKAFEDEE